MLQNRDISWIDFNHRVLLEAKDKSLPLYNRIKFLAIFSSNMDEFFRVRYPEIVALSKLNKKFIKKETLLTAEEITGKVHEKISAQLEEYGHILFNEILPELEENNIILYYNKPYEKEHLINVKEIFLSKILSFIQPIVLNSDKAKTFMPENNGMYLVATVKESKEDFRNIVLISIPSDKLQRFYVLPPLQDKKYITFIDDIICENLPMLFPGKEIESVFSVKINRNAELSLDDNFTTNLLDKIEKQLSVRDIGNTSRFLYQKGIPENLKLFLSDIFRVDVSDMFEGGRYHNLSDLMSLPRLDKELESSTPKPLLYPQSIIEWDIFKIISEKDHLLHLPYHSYAPVLTIFNQAAIDEDVTDIYITLYRVAKESHIVNALISAAKNGKNVTAFVELKARFDEANNIKWSRIMKKAGVKLIYSDVNLKVHSKIGLIRRKEDKGTKNYAIISTGNFNESTASFYTDHVLMTADKQITFELNQLVRFMRMRKPDFEKAATKLRFKDLYVSQFNMVPDFYRYIEKQMQIAAAGEPALIRIKVNNLEEPDFINKLYDASKAGVKVQLIVRSICCLVPGIKGLSENIEVKRIVDAHLEHSRLFYFGTDATARVIMGSSDLMTRNLYRRIEVCVRVRDKDCRQELLDYFRIQWEDNTKAYMITENGQEKIEPGNALPVNAQAGIFEYLADNK